MRDRFPDGCVTYRAYLRGRFWRAVRIRVLKRDHNQCQVCLERAECVHHIDYKQKTLWGEQDSSLISLCNLCHHAVEWDGDEKIPSSNPHRKAQLLDALMRKHRHMSLREWQGRKPRKAKPKRKKPKRKRDRQAAAQRAQQLKSLHSQIGAAADASLRAWRAMPHWKRRNLLVS